MQSVNTENHLVRQYFDICNTALQLNKNRFPFKQILGAAAAKVEGDCIEVIIKGQENLRYVVFIALDEIIATNHYGCKTCQCKRKWYVEKFYLDTVISKAETYICNPARIDWSWMHVSPD